MKPDSNAIAPQIVDRAAEWFVSLREPNVSREEREAFADWLRASPAHVHAYLDVARLWGDASKIDLAIEVFLESAPLPPNVVPLREEETSARRRDSRQQASRHGSRRLAIAATVVLALAAVFGAWWQGEHPKQYVTAIGEQRLITLDDGSIVRLNARSKISVRLSPELRRIEVIDGQALFEVAKDPQRPFIVQGGPVDVRAVGTQFDVYRRRSSTVVTVVEGVVEVRAGEQGKPWRALSSGNAAHLEMRAGERLNVSSAGQVGHEKHVDVERATSWLHQELTFAGESLGAVVEEFNRYSTTPIVIADPSLADLRINAVFHTTSPDSLLRFIDRMQDIEVVVSSEEILITRQR